MLAAAGRRTHADHQRLAARQAGRSAQARAGLNRVTVSLDSLDDATFRAMNDADFPVAKVIEGIEAAAAAGLDPIKINMVVKRGVNDGERRADGRALARHAATSCASSSSWTSAAPTAGAWTTWCPPPRSCAASRERWPLEPVGANYAGEVAERWRYVDGGGEIGVISSVTQAFCASCNRMRLSTEGSLYTCLFAQSGHDLKSLLRGGASDDEIRNEIAAVWQRALRPLLGNPHRGDREARKKSRCPTSVAKQPKLTNAARPATFEVEAYNERGEMVPTSIAGEHPLTLYLDKREIVTLMTLGHAPEALVHRLPAQPAPGRLDRRHRRGAGRLGNRFGRRHHAAAKRRRDARQENRHHRLRPGHGVRRPDGRDRHDPAAGTTSRSRTRTCSC